MNQTILVRRFERFFANPDKANSLLQPGDRGVACANLKRALCILGHVEPTFKADDDSDVLDEKVWLAVRAFQKACGHTRVDGLVGPVTRRLLVSALLENEGASAFRRLRRPDPVPQAFISYASKDNARVNKLDQWLRDNGVRVIRDQTDFAPGDTINDSIREAVAVCDKVVAVYSANSAGREWPAFETFVAGELESVLDAKLLVYIRLDDTALPERTAGRLYIDAREQTLKAVGDKLLQAITGNPRDVTRYEYDENLPL